MNCLFHILQITKSHVKPTRLISYGRDVRRFYEKVSVLALQPGQSLLSTIKTDRSSLSNPRRSNIPDLSPIPLDSAVPPGSTSPSKLASPPLPSRVPRQVLVAHHPLSPILPPDAPQYTVLLDGRPLSTPLGRPFRVPHVNVAEAVAHEWRSQPARRVGTLKLADMHLTQLCNTVIDRHEHEGDTVADVLRDLVGALETDTLLFRSDSPPELAPFLAQRWDPLLAWFSSRTGVRLVGSSALGVRSLDESERVRLSGAIGGMCAPVAGAPTLWRMHGVRLACRSLKSLVLALAVLDAHLSGTQLERVVQLASLEQEFQLQKWARFEDVHGKDGLEVLSRLRAGFGLALPDLLKPAAAAATNSASSSSQTQTKA